MGSLYECVIADGKETGVRSARVGRQGRGARELTDDREFFSTPKVIFKLVIVGWVINGNYWWWLREFILLFKAGVICLHVSARSLVFSRVALEIYFQVSIVV